MLPCLNHLSSSCAKALKCFLLSSPFTVKFSSFYSLFSFARGASHTKVWAIKIIWKCFPNINYRVRQPPTTSPSHTYQKPSLKHMVWSLSDHRSELKKNTSATSGYILCTCGGNSLAMLLWVSLAIFLALWENYHHFVSLKDTSTNGRIWTFYYHKLLWSEMFGSAFARDLCILRVIRKE